MAEQLSKVQHVKRHVDQLSDSTEAMLRTCMVRLLVHGTSGNAVGPSMESRREVAAWADKVTGQQCFEPVKEGLVDIVSAEGGEMPRLGCPWAIETTLMGVLETRLYD